MGRLIGLMTLGFISFLGSVVCGYFYLQYSDNLNPSAWIFLPPLVICLILAALLMLFANRSHDIYADNSNQPTASANDPTIQTLGLLSSLQKQNELVAQWRKTNHMKDKMTMIKIAANAQKQRP